MFGYRADEINGRSIRVLMPPDRAADLTAILDHIRSGSAITQYKTVSVASDDRRFDVSVTVRPIPAGSGIAVGAAVIVRDIGIELRADLALRTAEARWDAILDSAVDAIIVIDTKGTIESFNAAAERLFGYTEEEMRGRSVNLLMPSPFREEHDGYIARYLNTGIQKVIGIGREVTALRRDGTMFPVHLSVGEMRTSNERHFVGIVHDLTSRIALEEQLREQAAMAHLGEMAAVIAHEVKNPLTAVRGAIQVIGGRLQPESREASVCVEIVARLDALNDLIKDLLLFARPPSPRLAPVDVSMLLRLTVDLLSKDPALSRVRVDVVGTAPLVSGDAEFLKIVFQNLLLNAAQAMRGEGMISASVSSSGPVCRIQIADTGPGIAPEAREKLFRPFFTTKSRGTGLGLVTAKRLVEAHGGTITIESPPRGGTVVTVEVPQATESAPSS